MIRIPRGPCRSFPALARKCVSDRPRGPAPPVAFECRAGTLSVWARTDNAVLLYPAPARGAGDGRRVVPMAVLDAAAGPGVESVELAVGPTLRSEGPVHRPRRPDGPPDDWQSVPADLLTALHEYGRTTAKDAARFALTRVQMRGKAGQAAATDGRTALVWAGSRCPSPTTCWSRPSRCSARRS